jgi:hypothetical protein
MNAILTINVNRFKILKTLQQVGEHQPLNKMFYLLIFFILNFIITKFFLKY